MTSLDLTLPAADLLQKAALSAHRSAKRTKGAGWLFRGELDKEEYLRFLMMIWHINVTLEQALARHASYPTIQPMFNPGIYHTSHSIDGKECKIANADAAADDITFILGLTDSKSSWRSHAIHLDLLASPPPALTKYLSRLKSLSDSADPTALLAHAYVRFVGDLTGGQVIRERVTRAYGLIRWGVELYCSQVARDSWCEIIDEEEDLKERFYNVVNVGIGDSQERKAILVQEFIDAFELNIALFASLRAPKSKMASDDPAPPLLGNPMSNEEPGNGPEYIPIIDPEESGERMVSLSSVIAVVAAVCLAHFLLVVGGFTGDRGYSKLQMVEQWFDSVWRSLVG